jgi:hypothetical protein
MRIDTCCGSYTRELLLGQLVQPSDGFRCPVCGSAFAPAYATAASAVSVRGVAAQAALVTTSPAWSMTGDARQRWRRAATSPARSARIGRVTLGGPALCPGGPVANVRSRILAASPGRTRPPGRPPAPFPRRQRGRLVVLACRSGGGRIASSQWAMQESQGSVGGRG